MSRTLSQHSLLHWLSHRQVITPAQSELVQKWMESRNIDEATAILECGVLNEEDLLTIYGEIHKVRSIKLEELDIDIDAVKHVPAHIARDHMLIPFRRSANTLAVAMADPLDPNARNALSAVTDFEIIPFVARADAIEHAIFLHYGIEAGDTAVENDTLVMSLLMRSRVLSNDDRVSHMSKSIPLQRELTFATFYKSAENQYAVTAAQEMCIPDADAKRLCVIIAAPVGSGKTHLLHAAANEQLSRQPQSRVLLTSGERFAEFLFESVRDHKLNLYRYLLRELDLLLIDDADALLSVEWAQVELSETIKNLTGRRKRVCLTGSENWAYSPRMLPELRKLLEAGTTAELKPYSDATRLEIVRRKTAGAGIAPEILNQLIRQSAGDMPALLKSVKSLIVLAAQKSEGLSGAQGTSGLPTGAAEPAAIKPLSSTATEIAPLP